MKDKIRRTFKIKVNPEAEAKFFDYVELQYQYWGLLQKVQHNLTLVMKGIDKANAQGMAEMYGKELLLIRKEILEIYPEFDYDLSMEDATPEAIQKRIWSLPNTYRITDRQGKKRWTVKICNHIWKVKKEIPQFLKFIIENYKRDNFEFDSKYAIWVAVDEYDMPEKYTKMDDLFHTPEHKQVQDLLFEPLQKSEGTYRLRLDLWRNI